MCDALHYALLREMNEIPPKAFSYDLKQLAQTICP
jgi:hypothetical protein